MGYRVIAPVVVVKTMGDYGIQVKHIHQGGMVPDDAEQVWIDCHLRDQMIAPVAVDAPPAAAPLPPEPEPPKPEPKAAVTARRAKEE